MYHNRVSPGRGLPATNSRWWLPQLGQAWHEPARCIMSPQTWQSTISDARITCVPGVRGGSDDGVMTDADGGWSSSGRSA